MQTLSIALAFLMTVTLIPAARRVAMGHGFLDRPDNFPGGRKQHDRAVPPIGGLAIFPAFLLCLAPVEGDWSAEVWFYAASMLLLIVGALDDRLVLPPFAKFAAQFIAAALIVLPGQAQVYTLGNILGTGAVGLSVFSVPFSIVAAVLLINAINLMDGLDGLAGGMGVIILVGFAILANDSGIRAEMAILIAALVGFLIYNMRNPWRRKAIVFMGDAGSLTLGLAIAWFAMRLGGPKLPEVEPITIAWLLALPIMDTCGQFARRIKEGRHPFSADQDHFHHHFVRAGLTPGRATVAVLAVEFVYAAIGIGGARLGVPQPLLLGVWAALLAGHIALSMRPPVFRRLIAGLLGREAAAP